MIKTATVSARIDEDVKSEAEAILRQIGIPVSAVINTLYHQIIIQRGVPFSMTLRCTPPTLESLSKQELKAMLQEGLNQARTGEGRPLEDVFDDIERKHAAWKNIG